MNAAKLSLFPKHFVQARKSRLPDAEPVIGGLQGNTSRDSFGIAIQPQQPALRTKLRENGPSVSSAPESSIDIEAISPDGQITKHLVQQDRYM